MRWTEKGSDVWRERDREGVRLVKAWSQIINGKKLNM